MALKITVTKVSVTSKGEKFNNDFHTITMNLKVLDGMIEVINKNFSIDHKSIHPISDDLSRMKEMMKKEIQKYKAEKAIFTKLDTATTQIAIDLTEKTK